MAANLTVQVFRPLRDLERFRKPSKRLSHLISVSLVWLTRRPREHRIAWVTEAGELDKVTQLQNIILEMAGNHWHDISDWF